MKYLYMDFVFVYFLYSYIFIMCIYNGVVLFIDLFVDNIVFVRLVY